MADTGGNGKAKIIPWTEDDKLSLVVRLLFHQGPVKWDGFDIRTGHSQRAAGGILDRLKKKYVSDAGAGETSATATAAAATEDDGAKPKAAKKKGKKATKKTKKDEEQEVKDEEVEEESAADAPVEKKKRQRKPSKTASESAEPANSKTSATEAFTDSKGKNRSVSKTPVAEPKSKKVKTEVDA